MKRWQCGICGYIHEGDEPPDICPVCGAPKELFRLLDGDAPDVGAQESAEPAGPPGASQQGGLPRDDRGRSAPEDRTGRSRMKIPEHWYFHPIFVHFPQALFPVALASFVLYLATGAETFEVGAYVAAAFGALAAPLTTITGFLDWKFRYKAYLTSVFRIKITGAFVLIALSLPAALLRSYVPGVAALPLAGAGYAYAGLLAACAATCVVLGYYGGKLVFH